MGAGAAAGVAVACTSTERGTDICTGTDTGTGGMNAGGGGPGGIMTRGGGPGGIGGIGGIGIGGPGGTGGAGGFPGGTGAGTGGALWLPDSEDTDALPCIFASSLAAVESGSLPGAAALAFVAGSSPVDGACGMFLECARTRASSSS